MSGHNSSYEDPEVVQLVEMWLGGLAEGNQVGWVMAGCPGQPMACSSRCSLSSCTNGLLQPLRSERLHQWPAPAAAA